MANEFLSESDTPDFLKALAEHAGGVNALAKFCGVDKENLRKAIRGKLQPSAALLDRLGVERAVIYVLPRNLSEWYENYANERDGGEATMRSGEGGGDAH